MVVVRVGRVFVGPVEERGREKVVDAAEGMEGCIVASVGLSVVLYHFHE